jgi:IPT/TIG domain/Fibronectin type III domain
MNRTLSSLRCLRSRHLSLAALTILSLGCSLGPSASLAAATITYVQSNSAIPQTPQTSVPVTFTAAQAAGDLSVVVVGWNDSTATVSTVTDKSGNTYTRAVGPTVVSGFASQSIYYAKNIVAAAAGANIVTVTFSTAAAFPDIRILEYSGADPTNPVDVTAAGTGTAATSSSGSATTTNATDLIFGADMVSDQTSGPGTGFTQRVLTAPDGDIAEDEMVTATGSYAATAPIKSGQWIMQMVAFRTPTSGGTVPTVSSVSPNSGSTSGGTAVTITGTNFATGATVKFGATAATGVVVVSSTSITATTPAGTAGAVTVMVTVGSQSGSLASGFTYVGVPTVTSVSPNTGSSAGGTAVTIAGTNFATGATVKFGATAATGVVVVSSTSITATTPAGAAGAATVTVTVGAQSGSLTSGFTYVVIPTVTSVSPNTGSTAGGTVVTITGTNFATGATVQFGATAATGVAVVSSTSITATTPAGTAGAATVTVTVGAQSGSLTNGFTYVGIPTVTSVSPNTGSTAGGTAVTITGTNFATGATVKFGATAATGVVVASSTSITATTPAGTAGAATVTVTVAGQSGSLTSGFTYVVIPTVSSVSPNTGATAGGTAVTITGTNFATGATVKFGATAATGVVVVSATSITATTPAGTAGATTVTVTIGGQSGSLTNGFTYVGTPTVTSVSPNSGLTAGGTAVTITGTNFATGATVKFGATSATNVVLASSTSITATTPAGTAGAVTVTVTNTGSQSGSLTNGFTYVTATTITFVQGTSATPQSSQISVPVTFTAAQAAGDLNVIAVGWNDSTATISTVTDKSGNTYTRAVGPTIFSGFATQSIYYAKNIVAAAAGTNIVTVTFSTAASFPDIRILEYKGADPSNPVDVTAAATGTSATSNSGAVTTTNATDLIFGANLVQTTTSGPGTGFTSRLLTSPDADIAEDEMVTAIGSYSATAPLNSGEWIMQLVAFRTPVSGGGTPPTAPSNLTSTAAGASQINLSWTASTDPAGVTQYLVERCQGAGCSSFAQVGTSPTTTYSDSGLSASTSYSYRVRATDAAGNLSLYSNTATATTGASSTPTVPTNVSAVNGGPGPIIQATQSYDNPTSLTTHTMTAFDSTGGDAIIFAASSHNGVSFTPSDNFGNTFVPIAGPTNTPTGADLRTTLWYLPHPIVGPNHTVTMGLSIAQPLVMSMFVLKGSNAALPLDGVSVIGSDNGTEVVNVFSPTITTTVLNDLLIGFVKVSAGATFTAGTGFTLQTAPVFNFLAGESGPAAAAGNHNATMTINSAQTWESAVVAVANNPNQTTLTWSASTETGGTISQYLVQRCQGAGCSNFAQIGTTATTAYNDIGLTASTSYSYKIAAKDSSGTVGPFSSAVTAVTLSPTPTAPASLAAAANRQGPIVLTWPASTSSVGIADYVVVRCTGATCTNFAQIGTATGTSYTDSTVVPSTTYNYMVQAVDTTGNVSPYSMIATNTTVGNQPPTAPTNLAATAVSTTQINLSWTASTSSIGLANYVVERCQGAGCTNFTQLSTPTGTTYSDTGLAVGTSYSYEVEAVDIAGNVSPFSNIATATSGSSSGTTITYVQGNFATPQTNQTTVPVTFTAAQAAGDLNVVVVGWNDTTATVKSVTDNAGNTYTLAVGPTIFSGFGTQSIYYAKNIVAAGAGANTVTVTFSAAAVFADIRIVEYAGADPASPVDVTAAATGTSATSSSGAVTTSIATDLLFGANLVQTATTGPGTGFTKRLLTSPDGDIAEDQMVSAAGSYSATAPVSSGEWIMQMVAFHTATTCSGAPPAAPTNLTATAISSSQINLSWTASVSCAGVAHYVVQRCQGASCANFAQIGTSTGLTFSDTSLSANTSYSYQVQAVDNLGKTSSFSSVATTSTLSISISPRVSALTFTRTQQFTSSAGVTWSVDGVVGGSASTGTISTTGLYTPPSSAGTHTVTATNAQSSSASATVYITNYPGTFTYHNDNLRTGQNTGETVLTLSNVNQNQFGKLFSYPLDGIAFPSPLYVANVNIPGQGFHNVVYIETANDSAYAFDADGLVSTPLWHVSFLKSGVTPVPCADTGECGDIPTQIGITSTPVIDPSSGTIYMVAATKEGANNWVQRLHALDITTGAEKFGGPVVLQASVPGTGTGSAGGTLAFDGLRENQRTGLLLSNGVIYLGFGSHGDNSPWHGWVLGYNATTLQQTMFYNATPNGNGGGIWQGGGGLATDTSGDIYFVTSNGDFDANTGGLDYGDSVQKLSTTGTVVDYFTPHDQQNMSTNNLDLGAGGPVMLVDQTTGSFPHLLITAGKNGTIYVINRDNLGKYNANNDNQIVQSLPGVLPNGNFEAGNFSTPVFFNGFVYFGAINDSLKAFQMTNGMLSATPSSETAAIYEARGASFAISANSSSNGILWALQNNGLSADNDVGNPGVLFAYNANNLSTVLYNTSQAGSRDTLDLATKFSVPLVANGKVFVGGQTQLNVYGLLP